MLGRAEWDDPSPRLWPKIALFASFLAMLAAGWWFYQDNAGDRRERTIPPLAGELPARPRPPAKAAESDGTLQQANWLSKTYEELLQAERQRSAELEQELSTHEREGQLLVQERARTKELEEQLRESQDNQQRLAEERQRSKELEDQLALRQNDQHALLQAQARIAELEQQLVASRQPPPVQPPRQLPLQQLEAARTAVPDPAGAPPVYQPPIYQPQGQMPQPQHAVRRTGPRPLPKVSQPMPRLSLQANGLNYNAAGYWQVTATLVSNTSKALDARVQCTFLSAGQSVGEAEFGPTPVAPGEQISMELIGPPTATRVDSATCRLF
jgi:hypothetical protein